MNNIKYDYIGKFHQGVAIAEEVGHIIENSNFS